MKEKLNIISKIVMMLLTLCVLVVSIYAWYVSNDEASVSGITGLTSNDDNISFKSVTAKLYKLDGTTVENTYTIIDSGLYLEKSVTTNSDSSTTTVEYTYESSSTYIKKTTKNSTSSDPIEENNESKTTVPFTITDILPGEYIEVSIEYTLSSIGAKDVNISLKNITGSGSFNIQDTEGIEYTHYAMGAFKYKNISISKNSSTTTLSEEYKVTNDTTFKRNTTYYTRSVEDGKYTYTKESVTIGNTISDDSKTYYEDSYEWLYEYDIAKKDDASVDIPLYIDSWSDGETTHTFTFSIYEDFTQYYQLISQSTGSYGSLLSQKGINIGNIYFHVS